MVADPRVAGLRRRIERLGTTDAQALVPWTPSADLSKARLSLGHAEADAHFAYGGLGFGSHQFSRAEGDPAAARALILMLLARYLADHPRARPLVLQETSAVRETGWLYGPGLHALGLDPGRLIFLQTQDGAEALRAINEALCARVPQILLADLSDGAALADLSVTRRFNLAAQKARAVVLMATPDLSATSAALTRWVIGSASSAGAKRRLGAPTFSVDLVRNRHGRTGRWTLEWNSHDRTFQSPGADVGKSDGRAAAAMAASLASSSLHRPDQAGSPSAVLPFGAYRKTG